MCILSVIAYFAAKTGARAAVSFIIWKGDRAPRGGAPCPGGSVCILYRKTPEL